MHDPDQILVSVSYVQTILKYTVQSQQTLMLLLIIHYDVFPLIWLSSDKYQNIQNTREVNCN